jgi:GT2 family glycosyltransferase
MSRVTALLVNWNGLRYLPRCLAALQRQTLPSELVVVDNASTDGSVAYLRAEHPEVEVLVLPDNHGYAGGANAGIRATSAEYVMVMNPDAVLAPDHLAVLRARLHAEPRIGAAQGKLYQVRPNDYLAGEFREDGPLDSAGHRAARTRMVYDRGQGEPSGGRYEMEESVFSACGAALLLRRLMLDDIAPEGEFFDESFFAYKEDIDLCWRARLRGWDVRYVPDAVGWHVRGWAGSRPPPPHTLPLEARLHSFKNHYLLLLKNESAGNLLRHLPWIAGWELLRQGHALLRDRQLYRAYRELLRTLPATLRKRRAIQSRRLTPPHEIRRWFAT